MAAVMMELMLRYARARIPKLEQNRRTASLRRSPPSRALVAPINNLRHDCLARSR